MPSATSSLSSVGIYPYLDLKLLARLSIRLMVSLIQHSTFHYNSLNPAQIKILMVGPLALLIGGNAAELPLNKLSK